ncbi:precorrin-6y C5,15-methyltransferase (decarboxylating) subunit CbiE [Desulfovibrio cuneatus]|uniref:precorrin-6y C5,15-methyltransferase (decarboxylating) subunit CbiE n=1 Tax=Desulfovibrio cuneatus TaxID=159728 RepID=UPI00041B50BF|nr:precorrin-6y C5,15-methyltransferase (decarboxylating) subunit CbiE [Desulfovibrio cuneatus]
MPRIHILSLGLTPPQHWADHPPHGVANMLASAQVLVGGKAQLAPFADHPAQKITVSKSVPDVLKQMAVFQQRGLTQVVLCSGDALFFGLGASVLAWFGRTAVSVLPGVSSLQGAAALLGQPWQEWQAVSLHGRENWLPLAHAVLAGGPVAVLVDARTGLAEVNEFLQERGAAGYTLHQMEALHTTLEGRVQAEHVLRLAPEDSKPQESWQEVPCARGAKPRVIVLEPPALHSRAGQQYPLFGIDDALFAKEKGLITKSVIRAAGFAALRLSPHHTMWDLGGGSGAMAVEASRLVRQGCVYSVERHESRLALMRENRKRFAAVNMEIVQAILPLGLEGLPAPHRVFIGGGLGGAENDATQLLHGVWEALAPGGWLVAHCVLLSSLERCRKVLASLGASVEITCMQVSHAEPLGTDVRLAPLPPVFLVAAQKAE